MLYPAIQSRAFFCLFVLLLPLASIAKQIHEVRADGAADSRGAIQAAINQAIQTGTGSEVLLGPGRFHIQTPVGEKWCFTIVGSNGLTIRGTEGKTELVIHNPASGGFFVTGASNVWLKDLTIDYDPVPFTQGKVVAVDPAAGSFDLEIETGYPLFSESWFQPADSRWGLLFDGRERRLKAGASDCWFFNSWALVGGRTWRLTTKQGEADKLAVMAPGDRFALMARGNDGVCLFSHCRQSGIENVTVHASPSLTASLIGCDQMTIDRLAIEFKPGTTRLLASDGDGIHCQRNRRGPLIKGCRFEGMADDGINIYAVPNVVRKVLAPNRVLVPAGFDVGINDRLQIFNPREGKILGEVMARRVETKGDESEIEFKPAVPGITAGPDCRRADTIFNLSACGAGYVIRDNHFRHHRRHGALLRSGPGLVENNTFESNAGLGVVVTNEPEWPEGPIARDITIRNNKFIGGGYAAGYGNSPIGASVVIRGTGIGRLAADKVQKHMTIEGNTFINPPGAAIYIGAAEDVRILQNRVETAGTPPPMRDSAAVILDYCTGVRLDELTVQDHRPQRLAAVQIQGTVAPGNEGVTLGKIDAALPPQGAPIKDERPH